MIHSYIRQAAFRAALDDLQKLQTVTAKGRERQPKRVCPRGAA